MNMAAACAHTKKNDIEGRVIPHSHVVCLDGLASTLTAPPSDSGRIDGLPRVWPKNTPYKNLVIFRIILYFLVKFPEVIQETFGH